MIKIFEKFLQQKTIQISSRSSYIRSIVILILQLKGAFVSGQ